ncbi:MAG: hypothetical protein GX995_01595 [Clostridiales bacterium]|nr:hypothetical protein [Clostridiales bacterium]
MKNKIYIKALIQSQYKKIDILKRLVDLTKEQAKLLEGSNFDQDVFTEIIEKKAKQINQLAETDDGFLKIFEQVKEELEINKGHENEIEELKDTINTITNLSSKLQTDENNNKKKLETYLTLKRKEVKDYKRSKSMASSYQRNLDRQDNMSSHFFDSKK